METDIILEMRDICKSFAGVRALDHVDFRARRGTVNVLMGENGAGKSTLMRILAGAHSCDSGEIVLNGKRVLLGTPKAAMENHIAMIYQELNLVQDMTVEENIFIGREICAGGFLKRKELRRRTQELLQQYGVQLSPDQLVGELSVANQQMLEIVKALSLNAQILIMDEPTSSLTAPEVRRLFDIIQKLKQSGVSIIYISHRMEEIYEIGDYVTIMRDGHYIGEWSLSEIDQKKIIELMVGREIKNIFPKHAVTMGEIVLQVEHLSRCGMFEDVSFTLRKGEILGVSGLVGAGRTEMAMTIFGAYRADGGRIILNGREVKINSPDEAIRHRIAYLPEDRKKLGIDLESKISTNIAIANLDLVAPRGFVKRKKEAALCKKLVEKLHIKTPSIYQQAGNLSGGNQQKIVLAKWLARDLNVLILDEPTRGVDIGAKEEIHRLMVQLAEQGLAIILISSELPEVLGMSDRVLVMHEGRQKAILSAQEATQESVMEYAMCEA